jgi:hypothetical protein
LQILSLRQALPVQINLYCAVEAPTKQEHTGQVSAEWGKVQVGRRTFRQRRNELHCVDHYLCDICMLQMILKLIINPGVPFLEYNSHNFSIVVHSTMFSNII